MEHAVKALLAAVAAGDAARLAQVIARQPQTVASHGGQALLLAARDGDVDVARVLVQNGADLEAVDDEHRDTPLGWAAFYAQAGVAVVLLEAGANREHQDGYGNTPLGYALKGAAGDLRKYRVERPAEAYLAVAEVLRQYGAEDAE
jgi:ankyrin repeat protein